ncbi:hypothetical protein [Pseudochelatococcus sp.]|uniref:hypothetical protein n=1 Tax=Pseudochelatococcus sp. TaxID=2020869 RepID=UPI003D8DAA44
MAANGIPPDLMMPLARAISAAFGAGEFDRILVRTTGRSLFKFYTHEQQPMDDIAYQTLDRLDQLGFQHVVLAAAVLSRPDDAGLRDLVGRACPAALDGVPGIESQVRDIIGGANYLRAQLSRDDVRAVVEETRGTLTAVAGALVVLDIYKRLHDCLHQVQIKQLSGLRAALQRFTDDPLRIAMLQEYQAQLRLNCDLIADQIARLPQDYAQRALEAFWHDSLGDAVARLRSGLDNRDRDETVLALRDIQDVMRQVPSRLNARIFATADAIPLGAFGEALRKVEEAIAPDGEEIAKARAALRIVHPTIGARVVEHRSWQEADKSIAALEELFDHDNPEREVEFMPYWGDVKRRVRELAALDAGDAWAADVLRYIDAFDDILASEQINGGLRQAFASLRLEARFRFFRVDKILKEQCAELVKISEPLSVLLGRQGHA